MKSLYGLLIGINDYQTPYKKLQGCRKDVQNVNDYIHDSLGDTFELHIKTLVDDQATYDNVINTFERHLGQATVNDVVWFHFSGHGSEEWSAPEFHQYDTTKKDQTMLCYDSLPDKAYNFADKEMAALIHKVATTYPNGDKKEGAPHILISMDCCHSGSGTRSSDTNEYSGIRSAQTIPRERPLSSYANGFYSTNSLSIPLTPHIHISACRRHEVAGDSNSGGALTSGLLRALKESKNEISYADLYLRTRAAVRKMRPFQNPKFSFLSEMSPYSFFLSSRKTDQSAEYEVYFKGGQWRIKYGVIHGLIQRNNNKIEVEILKANKTKRKVGSAQIVEVGTQESLLEFSSSFWSFFSSIIGFDKIYIGSIRSLPIEKEVVSISGNEALTNDFINEWSSFENIIFSSDDNQENNIGLCIDSGYSLIDLNIPKEVYFTKDQKEAKIAIHKMTRWFRFLNLENLEPLSTIADDLALELELHNATEQSIKVLGNTQIIKASFKQKKSEKLGLMPKVYIKNGTRDYYFYLFYMDEDYSITCPEEELEFRGDSDGDGVTDIDEMQGNRTDHRNANEFHKAEATYISDDFKGKNGLAQDLWKDVKGITPSKGQKSATIYLKLIVTSEELDYFQFIQSGLEKKRSDNSREINSYLADDWATYKIELTVTKED